MTGDRPHIPVFDKSQRTDGTFSREDFTYDTPVTPTAAQPGRHSSTIVGSSRPANRPDEGQLDALPGQRARLRGVSPEAALLPHAPARKISRSIYEGARDLAREIAKTDEYQTSRRQRKKVEMLFTQSAIGSDRLGRLVVPDSVEEVGFE